MHKQHRQRNALRVAAIVIAVCRLNCGEDLAVSPPGSGRGTPPSGNADAGAVVDAGAGAVADAGAVVDAGAGAVADAGADPGTLAPQWIGGPCQTAADCSEPGSVCLTQGFAGGHCSLPCARFCPDKTGFPITFCIDDDNAGGFCVARCASDTDCRAGYRCGTRGRMNEPRVLQSVCVPPDARPTQPAQGPFPARHTAVEQRRDKTSLESVFATDGITVPTNGKIMVARISAQGGALRYEYFDYKGTTFDSTFWPASTIKVHAAIAAIETLEDHGHSVRADVAFDGGYAGPFRTILNEALINSSNSDYDLLVLITGFDELNSNFLAPARGFLRTVIQRSYGPLGSLRRSPDITITEDGGQTILPARTGTGTYPCGTSGNCTDAFELSEAVRRVALHERLPAGEPFRMHRDDLAYLRFAMASNVWDPTYNAADAVLGAGNHVIYRKGGYAGGWRIENAYLRAKVLGDAYLLVMILADSTPDATFEAIAKSALGALRTGRLANPNVVP